MKQVDELIVVDRRFFAIAIAVFWYGCSFPVRGRQEFTCERHGRRQQRSREAADVDEKAYARPRQIEKQ